MLAWIKSAYELYLPRGIHFVIWSKRIVDWLYEIAIRLLCTNLFQQMTIIVTLLKVLLFFPLYKTKLSRIQDKLFFLSLFLPFGSKSVCKAPINNHIQCNWIFHSTHFEFIASKLFYFFYFYCFFMIDISMLVKLYISVQHIQFTAHRETFFNSVIWPCVFNFFFQLELFFFLSRFLLFSFSKNNYNCM